MKKRLLNVLLIYIISSILFFSTLYILKIIDYKCPYKELLHIYCAGCGTTRMIKSIFVLDFISAFRFNPLMFILLPITGIYLIYISFKYVKGNKIPIPNSKIFISIGIILIIYMILRNIPQFSFLAPIE